MTRSPSPETPHSDLPPSYEQIITIASTTNERNVRPQNSDPSDTPAMPRRETLPLGSLCYKLILTVVVVAVAIIVACIVDSYHKINEGFVGIYFRHGALQTRVTEPGVHFMLPFFEDYKEVKIRPETYSMDPVPSITKDGITNTFREITAITKIKREKIVFMAKTFGMDFKKALVYDRIKEDLRIFCANHTIDEVYNTMFLDIVGHVTENVKMSIKRLGQDGIEILNLVIPKPEIPTDIARNYKQVKVQWTEQLVATQQQKTEKIKKETELIKAVADAERHKKVLEIEIQERIMEKEGNKNVSLIENEIKRVAESNEADIAKYKLEKEAEANELLYTEQYTKLHLAKSLTQNAKFYFSGQNSELGGLMQRILGSG